MWLSALGALKWLGRRITTHLCLLKGLLDITWFLTLAFPCLGEGWPSQAVARASGVASGGHPEAGAWQVQQLSLS